MKTIGLLGGMSWESTLTYYQEINRQVQNRLKGLHSAKILLHSVDFQVIADQMRTKDWAAIGTYMAEAGRNLEMAGAELLLLCTNTIHKVAADIETALDIPFLHIADAAAEVILQSGISTIGLLGTRLTMEEDFYRVRLRDRFGLTVIIPEPEDRALVDRVIFEELCLGKINPASKKAYERIAASLAQNKAEGILLGCTEIALLLPPEESALRLFDTTRIHARKAVAVALGDDQ